MGRAPCCEKVGLNRGPWTREEDLRLIQYIESHREGSWRTLPKAAGLLRCGKSCRLRWINYLRPDLKRGNITEEEDRIIIKFHATLGNRLHLVRFEFMALLVELFLCKFMGDLVGFLLGAKVWQGNTRWSLIAANLPGRTDNEIKNYWNTHLKKKLRNMGLDPQTHQPLQAAASSSTSLREMIKVDAGSMKGRNANSTEEFYCRPMDPQTHQPLQASSTSSTSLREIIKVDAGSMKGRNANSTEEFYYREKLFSSPYFSDDLTVTPSNSRSNYSLIASNSGSFDIRSRDLNISQVMQELARGSEANSINNLLTMWSDNVNNGSAPIYSTTCQAVHYNSITTNSEDLINLDNNPSALDLHLFPNVPSSNALLSLIDNEILSGSQIINMDGQHRRVEEELDAAAAGLPNAFHESTSSDLWNL